MRSRTTAAHRRPHRPRKKELAERPTRTHARTPAYICCRQLPERLLASVLLLISLPLLFVLMALVRLFSRGPAIYSQTRVGLHGRLFIMHKLRTMRSDAEMMTGPVWSPPDDPRVTNFGRWLRKMHLDELPQLINVMRGEMSLVGPRPERPEFTQQLALVIPNYLDRLQVLPGVSGLAQINLPPDLDLNSVRQKLILDLEYVNSATIWLDLRILLCTAARFLGMNGYFAARVFRVQRCMMPPHTIVEQRVQLAPALHLQSLPVIVSECEVES